MIRTWVAIRVADVRASSAWYRRLLGCGSDIRTHEFVLRDPDGYVVSVLDATTGWPKTQLAQARR